MSPTACILPHGVLFRGNAEAVIPTPLPQLTDEVATLAARVDEHLKKMGANL